MPTPPPLPSHSCAQITSRLAADFIAYINSADYMAYIHRLYIKPPIWRPLRWLAHFFMPLHLRNVCEANMPSATPRLGLVILRNASLSDPDQAAPALVLASSNFSPEGLEELHAVAEKVTAGDDLSDGNHEMDALLSDDEYQPYRRRPLPASMQAPEYIELFDETMRGRDFLEVPTSQGPLTHPFVLLFANSGPKNWSAVVPGHIAIQAARALVKDKYASPPPLPPSAKE